MGLLYFSQDDKWGKMILGICLYHPNKNIMFLIDILKFLQWMMIDAYQFTVPQEVCLVAKNNTTQCHKYIPYSHTVKMKIATVWWEMLNIMESIQLQSSIIPTRI